MKQLEEFVNEKLKVTKDNVTPGIPLGEQGWECTSVNSIYSEIYQADDFFKSCIDLMSLYSMDTEDYTEDRVIIFDKIFQALKRRKWCKKIINIILSEYTFEEGIEKVQEVLKHAATCKLGRINMDSKRQVVRILDPYNYLAMILSFTKL